MTTRRGSHRGHWAAREISLRILCGFLVCIAAAAAARAEAPVLLSPEAIEGGKRVDLGAGWRYRAGDDAAWADPALDDAGWEALESPRFGQWRRPASGFPGIGWFRLRVAVDPALAGRPVALALVHYGASEVYVDGRLAHTFGRVGATPDAERTFNPQGLPVPLVFDAAGEHVLAIRYSCARGGDGVADLGRILTLDRLPPGFSASLADPAAAALAYDGALHETAVYTMIFVGVLAAFGLLHILLFAFYPRQRANLFYSLFAFSFALNAFTGYVIFTSHAGYGAAVWVNPANLATIAAMFLFFLLFLYEAYGFEVPRYFWALAALWAAAVLAVVYVRSSSTGLAIGLCIGLSVTAAIRAMVRALRLRLDGAWIIGAGVQILAFGLLGQLLGRILPAGRPWFSLLALAGFYGLPICVSIYLARAFARTSRNLEVQLGEVRRLAAIEVEHERKAKELEEARQLQLSMLPAKLPDLPNLEIAAYMKPATEVGGDYYDFHVAEDGTLTVAVGDATGHGLKAGTMVTATKGLFNALADEPDIPRFFHRSSRALKRLNLRYLYMALTLAKVKDNHVRFSAAGMPPALIFRAATAEVEEVAIRGLPLGGGAVFPYEEREVELAPGDVLVFMSDGFPERFNASGEMLDYARAREVLAEIAHEPPVRIIEHFVATGEAWADGHPQNDDVTFVVMKVRSADPEPAAVAVG